MPPASGRKRRRARPLEQVERREMLLGCAIRVFARRGIGAARHSEVAREATVSVPTVFFYFPTRPALVQAVLEEVARFFDDMTERIHASDRAAPDIMFEHGRVFADSIDTHPDYARVLLEWSTALRDEIWPLYLRFNENNVRTIARTIKRWRTEIGSFEGPDAEAAAEDDARVLGAAGYVVAQMRVTRLPNHRVERFLKTVIRDTLGEVSTA